MDLSSPQIVFDHRLESIEDLLRQRRFADAAKALAEIDATELAGRQHELGLYHSLQTDCENHQGNYQRAVEHGLKAARILADYPVNRRYGRIQLLLSKAYYAVGDMKNAEIRARDSLAAYRRASDSNGQIDALNQLAGITYLRCGYAEAASCLEEAISGVAEDPRKVAQLSGNLARTQIRTGQWELAEENLKSAIIGNNEYGAEMSQAMNRLSLGMLQTRRRQFTLAQRSLDDALEIISRLDLKRERVIYAEYAGELALEKGDLFKAKAILTDAYHKGIMLAPSSALVSQSARRLAEVELALDNFDEAMKFAQKSLETSLQLGEKIEIGLSRSVIARVFLARGDGAAAEEHIAQAVDILREVGDPYELGRTLLSLAEVGMAAEAVEYERVRAALDQARRLFRRLKSEYWVAETEFKAGVFACQWGDLARGFKKLSRAERSFRHLKENVRVRAVSRFLRSLSDQAVALSTSDKNEYKVFGRLAMPGEDTDLHSLELQGVLETLSRRLNGHRALILVPGHEEPSLVSSVPLDEAHTRRFEEGFSNLLGQEISKTRPTLVLDCRRDPFINGLFSDSPDVICSVVVVPFKTSGGVTGYLYVDRLSRDNGIDPFNQSELNFTVGYADLVGFKWTELIKNQLLQDNQRLKSQLQKEASFPNLITHSAAMLRMLAQVRQVIDSNITISVEGETGSGKDVLARAIHYNSVRRDKRFISVNCAALPESLLESELFGYKRGAFTGADRDKAGLFEEADGGTFFLDEIADMPLSIQAKVLRILEEKEVVRLGETIPRKVDVRIVSATNKDLRIMMDSGQFRQDLYYRLSAMSFRLPPLRERKEDIPLLINHFLEGTGKRVGGEVLRMLMAYDWPGNVRELENEIKKMSLLSADNEVIGEEVVSSRVSGVASDQETMSDSVAAEPVFDAQYSLYDYLAEHEKKYIVQALREKHGVKKHAAALLNIPESTLRLKIKQYDIDLDRLN
ncbi:MAG TPA: sigma 54-interacting transcriptional regulator [candidate division Zixibacteria bacterium]|mgnify:CR=1 FL=1|nr:sigma 54-interacting transcriptional regulator [candidate division Zixibacteria bacterium]